MWKSSTWELLSPVVQDHSLDRRKSVLEPPSYNEFLIYVGLICAMRVLFHDKDIVFISLPLSFVH